MKPLRASATQPRAVIPDPVGIVHGNHDGRMDVQSRIRRAPRDDAETRMYIGLQTHAIVATACDFAKW
jgi:hypothetical protein